MKIKLKFLKEKDNETKETKEETMTIKLRLSVWLNAYNHFFKLIVSLYLPTTRLNKKLINTTNLLTLTLDFYIFYRWKSSKKCAHTLWVSTHLFL